MHSHKQPVTEDDCEDLQVEHYGNFLQLISPNNKDFTELVTNRQLDRDMMQNQNDYIEKIETIEYTATKIKVPDPF